jgi:phage terminase large subunit-like protein
MKHLRPWLYRAGFPEEQIEGDFAIFQDFGQGFQSMSPALRDLETALLTRRLAHGNHPLLKINAANAVVQVDPSGNHKLTKAKSRGRIDGMAALAMAVKVGTTDLRPTSPWDTDPGLQARDDLRRPAARGSNRESPDDDCA